MALPKLEIEVSASSAKLKSDMDRIGSIVGNSSADMKQKLTSVASVIENSVGRSMDKMGLNIGGIASKLTGVGLAVTGIAAGAGGVAALSVAFSGAIKSAADLYDMSLKTGASVENLSAIAPIAKIAGTSIEDVGNALVKLTKNLEATGGMSKGTSDSLKRLGINIKDIAGKDSAEQMMVIAKAMENLGSGTAKTAIATELFGKSGANQLKLLHDLAQQGNLQAKVTLEQAMAANQYEDSLRALSVTKDSLTKKIALEMLPSANALIKTFTEMAKESNQVGEAGQKLAKNGDIAEWAKIGSYSLAGLVDVARMTKDVFMMLPTSIATAIKAGKALLSGDLAGADEARKWGNKEMQGRIDSIKAGFTTIESLEKNYRDKQSAILRGDGSGSNGGGVANPQGDSFLKMLTERSKKLEAGEYSLLRYQSIQKGVEAQAKPLIDAIKALDETKATDNYSKTLELQNQSMGFQIELVGKTAKEVEILNIQHKATLELEKRIADMQLQKGEVSDQAIAKMTAATEASVQVQINAINRRREAEQNWSTGTTNAFNKYIENAENAGLQAENALTNGFKGIEDSLVSLVTTGQMSFQSLATSMIADMSRMYIKAAILAPLMRMITGGGGGATVHDYSTAYQANGGVWSGGVQMFANGGVVDSPTAFGTSSGLGIMGEAGAEAILPLSRDGSGKLGVKGGANNININVVNEGGKDGYQATATARQNDNGIDIDVMVRKAVGNDLRNNGAMSQQIASTFGLRRAT